MARDVFLAEINQNTHTLHWFGSLLFLLRFEGRIGGKKSPSVMKRFKIDLSVQRPLKGSTNRFT